MTDRRDTLPAALLLAGTGVVHVAATPAHLEQATVLGVGFAVVGLAQLAAAALVSTRPSPLVRGGAVVLQLGAIAAWALSRTAGLPVGAGGPEPIGLADAVTVAIEGLSVLVLLVQPRRHMSLGTTAAVAVAAVLSLAGTATAIVALDAGHTHAPGEDHDAGHAEAPPGHEH